METEDKKKRSILVPIAISTIFCFFITVLLVRILLSPEVEDTPLVLLRLLAVMFGASVFGGLIIIFYGVR